MRPWATAPARRAANRAMRRGFSLLECMLAVALLALLAGVALPMQQGAWQRGQRALARQALAQAGGWVEREQTLGGQWPGSLPDPPPWSDGLNYRLTLSIDGAGYILRAAPQGRQLGDACGVLWLNDQGLRGADEPGCW